MKMIMRLSLILAFCYNLACHPNSDSHEKAITVKNLDLNAPGAKATVALVQKAGEAYTSFCTGTLVAPRLVLTSATCLRERSIQEIKILFGNSVGASDSVVIGVEDGMVESNAAKKYYPNRDLAWLRLQSDAPSSAFSKRPA
jgi:secreted trypsin-like serine protease